jgi:hypothetical protein
MTQVNHPTFGTGTVLTQDDKTVTVNFNSNIKVLAAAFSKLTNLDGSKYGEQYVAKENKPKKLNKSNFSKDLDMSRVNEMTSFEKMHKSSLEAETGRKGSYQFLKSI